MIGFSYISLDCANIAIVISSNIMNKALEGNGQCTVVSLHVSLSFDQVWHDSLQHNFCETVTYISRKNVSE